MIDRCHGPSVENSKLTFTLRNITAAAPVSREQPAPFFYYVHIIWVVNNGRVNLMIFAWKVFVSLHITILKSTFASSF